MTEGAVMEGGVIQGGEGAVMESPSDAPATAPATDAVPAAPAGESNET